MLYNQVMEPEPSAAVCSTLVAKGIVPPLMAMLARRDDLDKATHSMILLEALVTSGGSDVCSAVVEARAIEALVGMVADERRHLGCDAARTLYDIAGMQSRRYWARAAAAGVVGQVAAVLRCLEHQRWLVHLAQASESALHLLQHVPQPVADYHHAHTSAVMLRYRSSQEQDVHLTAVKLLHGVATSAGCDPASVVGDLLPVIPLLQQLLHSFADVSSWAAEALGELAQRGGSATVRMAVSTALLATLPG